MGVVAVFFVIRLCYPKIPVQEDVSSTSSEEVIPKPKRQKKTNVLRRSTRKK